MMRRAAYSSSQEGIRKLQDLIEHGLVDGIVTIAKLKDSAMHGVFIHVDGLSLD
jgi:hypothetical protein